MAHADQQIPRRKLADEVLDRLLLSLEHGEVTPGQKLPGERTLMARYGVGRPAVREALQALEKMGLIEIQHGERARVVALEAKDVFRQMDAAARHLLSRSPTMRDSLREARLEFETAMVRRAAQRASARNAERLAAAIAAQRACQGDAARFIAADIAFHVAIAGMAGNPLYAALAEAMLGWAFEFFPRMLRAPGTEELTLKEHSAIARAVAKGDPDAAARAMRRHLLRAHPLYRQAAR
jgi:GntR family transcriptional regulator, sialic acid-inducible nan operon repressor